MKTKFRMRTPTDIRRAVTRVANMVADGELSPQRGSMITSAANTALKAIEMGEQQAEMKRLQVMLMEIEKRQKK